MTIRWFLTHDGCYYSLNKVLSNNDSTGVDVYVCGYVREWYIQFRNHTEIKITLSFVYTCMFYYFAKARRAFSQSMLVCLSLCRSTPFFTIHVYPFYPQHDTNLICLKIVGV